ncbi:MAG: zinc ribbon domain-containing protein [Gemmatimonadaceae bacterium]
MLELGIGTLLAIGALAFVLYPLFVAPRARARVATVSPAGGDQEAVVALREIEFDRETGKLSDSDYAELKTRYTERALAAMRAAGGQGGDVDAVEAAVAAYRSRLKDCGRCGPRPEPDAIYCSNCGSFLPGACGSCGAPVGEAGAAFCASCGRALAA